MPFNKLSNQAINISIAFTDGSSDSTLEKGKGGVFFTHANGESECHKIYVGEIASNDTRNLVAIKETNSLQLQSNPE